MGDDHFAAQGINGTVVVTTRSVVIQRGGVLSRLGHGVQGEREIPFDQLTAVELRRPGAVTNGFIRFSYAGADQRRSRNPTTDANAVVFTKKHTDEFVHAKELIDSYLNRI